jgi:RNase P subunit RPR2
VNIEENKGITPSTVFALVGHEQRVDILLALLKLFRSEEEYPASFSSLKDASGIAVSAQFNYHLQQLTGTLLDHSEEGYAFSVSGWELATGILAGTHSTSVVINEIPIDGTCPLCEGTGLAIDYERGWLSISCKSCSSELTSGVFSPGGLKNRSPGEVARVFDRLVRTRIRLVRAGICPWCNGVMHPVVGSADRWKTAGRDAAYWCERCGNRYFSPIGRFLLESPLVRDFHREQGADREALSFWEHRFCVDDEFVSITERREWRCEISIEIEDTLVVELNEDLAIVSAAIE